MSATHSAQGQRDTKDPRLDAPRVLIVERDTDAANALVERLAGAGFAVTTLMHVEEARSVIDRDLPHLIMLDWDLPQSITRGLVRHLMDTARAVRPHVMALSLESSEQQIVSGLELGLDDYVVKPFSVSEVVARVKAMLRSRKSATEGRDVLEFHRLRLDVSDRRLTIDNQMVSLRRKQFCLLEFLMRHPECVFSRERLLRYVWGENHGTDIRAVDINVQRIRRTLAPHRCDKYVQTVRSVGYRMSAGEAR